MYHLFAVCLRSTKHTPQPQQMSELMNKLNIKIVLDNYTELMNGRENPYRF